MIFLRAYKKYGFMKNIASFFFLFGVAHAPFACQR